MALRNNHKQIHLLFLMLIAFTLPFSIKLNSFIIVLAVINVLFVSKTNVNLWLVMKDKLFILFSSLFVLYILSAFLSSNFTEGMHIIERRACLIALPLIILYYKLEWKEIKWILISFTTAILIGFVICIFNAISRYFINSNSEVFFYHQLSSILQMNAVYLSAYTLIAIQFLLYSLDDFSRVISFCSIICLSIFCILLNSKLMLLLLLFTFIFWMIKSNSFKYKYLLSAGLLVIVVLSLFFIPNVKNRFRTELDSSLSVVSLQKFNYDTPFTGITFRLTVWKICFEKIKADGKWLLGYHVGDFQDVINSEYKRKNIFLGDNISKTTGYFGYGPHNQYIEMLFSVGIFGLMLFFYLLINIINCFYRHKNHLGIHLIALFLIFFCTESVLSTNKGIICFSYFVLLYYQFQHEGGILTNENSIKA